MLKKNIQIKLKSIVGTRAFGAHTFVVPPTQGLKTAVAIQTKKGVLRVNCLF